MIKKFFQIMKLSIALFAVVLVLFSGVARADANGGTKCVACTALVALVEQSMQIKQVTAQQAISDLCSYLPSVLSIACDVAVSSLSEKVIPLIEAGENPDAVCHSLGFCFAQTAVCRLFPANKTEHEFVRHTMKLRQRHNVGAFNICTIIPGVCSMENHEPFSDVDGDLFSTAPRLRGSDWRGKDCDDTNKTIFPGRNSHDVEVDENCNGIYGVDAASGKSYEDLYCANSGAIGVAALGDSATAHFRIPPNWVTASQLSSANFAHLLDVIENEADWPMLSWSTGHMNASNYSPDIEGPMTSLYSLLNERNRCNHRDFQNVGVNGARVSDLVNFDTYLSRNRNNNVKPLLLIYSMVGNDVCNGHHDFNEMTTPIEYYNRILAALQLADTFLPANSHVVLIPLVDGRILYETMHARIHPIGSTNNDVTYTDFYNYLNCVEVSPCWGWMNSNETVRNTTWSIAASLNAQLPKLVNDTKGQFANFQLHFLGNIYDDAIQTYPGPLYEIIEPVDGFHPSQYGNSWIGQYLFNKSLEAGIVGEVNPFNADIIAKFGDQGGY
jgi:acyloxyacyl hydrolase